VQDAILCWIEMAGDMGHAVPSPSTDLNLKPVA